MKKAIIASLAAVTILGSTAVYAQHRFHHPHHARISPQDRAAFIDARIAAVKAGLQLTPDQEKNWPPVEAAVRDFAKMRADRANARASEWEARRAARANSEANSAAKGDKGDKPQDRAEQGSGYDPIARLHERADSMAATAAGLKRIADAADPLYKSLDDSQKRRLRVLTRMGWREHGFGEEHGRGFDRDNWRSRDGGRDRDRSDRPERL
ncbi:MAG TPA: Spy/CpxP family protein refolding chaperone [Afipia sp.]